MRTPSGRLRSSVALMATRSATAGSKDKELVAVAASLAAASTPDALAVREAGASHTEGWWAAAIGVPALVAVTVTHLTGLRDELRAAHYMSALFCGLIAAGPRACARRAFADRLQT